MQGVPLNAPGDDVRSKYAKLLNISRLLFWFCVIDCLFVLILSVMSEVLAGMAIFILLLLTGAMAAKFVSLWWSSVYSIILIFLNCIRLELFILAVTYFGDIGTGVAVGVIIFTVIPLVFGIFHLYYAIKFLAELTRIVPEQKHALQNNVEVCCCGNA